MDTFYLFDDMIDDYFDGNDGVWLVDIIDGEAYSWYSPNTSGKHRLTREDFAE